MDILVEQLVYGSFPFWERGYDVLARSAGCRADWVAEVLACCRKFGEAPSGVTPASALFSMRLASGPRAIVGVEPLGLDDRGRPGALAFHALLVDPSDYRKAGSNPFAFLGALRRDWSSLSTLTPTFWTVEVSKESAPPTIDSRGRRIIDGLARGRRVAIESPSPIDLLARSVWLNLPESVRRRASVATWAFGNANRFDLVALPRLAGVELDRSYLDPASIDLEAEPKPAPPLPYYYRREVLVAASLAGVVGTGLAWRGWEARRRSIAWADPTAIDAVQPPVGFPPEVQARVLKELQALADRLEVGGSNDPGDLLATIATRFHYQGPTLSDRDLGKLASEPDTDRVRALDWHERITRTFAEHQRLPDGFARLPLPRQLESLARSFQLTDRDLDRIPEALGEALSRDGPIRPTPLAARYPALSDYARFLARLPRRSSP